MLRCVTGSFIGHSEVTGSVIGHSEVTGSVVSHSEILTKKEKKMVKGSVQKKKNPAIGKIEKRKI